MYMHTRFQEERFKFFFDVSVMNEYSIFPGLNSSMPDFMQAKKSPDTRPVTPKKAGKKAAQKCSAARPCSPDVAQDINSPHHKESGSDGTDSSDLEICWGKKERKGRNVAQQKRADVNLTFYFLSDVKSYNNTVNINLQGYT